MKEQRQIAFAKFKKVHATIIGFLIFGLLIKIFGVDFFLVDFVDEAGKYNISISKLDEMMKELFVYNLRNIVIIFFLLRIKHGDIYKYIIVGFVTLLSIFMIMNIFHSYSNVSNIFSAMVLYMPKYTNFYIYIIAEEKAEYFMNRYNQSNTIMDELKTITKLVTIVASVSVILSFIQAGITVIAI